MDISVNMSAEEFQEFMEYRRDREQFDKERKRLRAAPAAIAASLFYGVEPVNGKPGRFKIVDQDHMADAWDAAKEFMPKK